MARHIARSLLAVCSLALGAAGACGLGAAPRRRRRSIVLPDDGHRRLSVMAQYLAEGIARGASSDGAAAVVIKLNTPGGALDLDATTSSGRSSRRRSRSIVWVAPAGGCAASAGTFITLAANIASMAPGTSIGAASPVGGQGEDIRGTLGEKVKNDAIAKMPPRSPRRATGTSTGPISTVADAQSSPRGRRSPLGAVDGIAATLDDVLAFANGQPGRGRRASRSRSTSTGRPTTEVDDEPVPAAFVRSAVGPDDRVPAVQPRLGRAARRSSTTRTSSPGILGGLAIDPGVHRPRQRCRSTSGGLILIVFGLVLIGLELTVTSHGLLGSGGILCIALGASALLHGAGRPVRARSSARGAALSSCTGTITASAVHRADRRWSAVRTRRHGPRLAGPSAPRSRSGTHGVVRARWRRSARPTSRGEEWTARIG